MVKLYWFRYKITIKDKLFGAGSICDSMSVSLKDVKSRLKHDAFLLYNKSEALAVYGFLKTYGITPVYLLEIKEDNIHLCKVDSRYV